MAHHDNTTGVDGTHKPTMGEKLGGKMESMVGKMTGNHAKVAEGEAKATGNLPATGAHGTDAHGAHGNTLGHDNRTTGTGLTGDNHGTDAHGAHGNTLGHDDRTTGTGLAGDNHGTHGTGLTGNNTHGSTGTYPATGAIPPHQGSGLTGNNHGTGLTGNRDTYGNDNYGSTPVVVGGATHGSGLTGNNHGTGIAGNRDTYGNDHHGHQGEKKESLLDKITPGHNAHGFEGNQESRVGHDNYGTTGVAGTHGTGLAGNNHGTGVTGHREPYTVPGNTHGTTHGAGLNAGGPYRDDDLKTRGTEKKSLLDKITPGHNAHGFSGNQTGSATDGLGARDQGLAGRYQDAGIITQGHNNRGVNDSYGQTAHPTGFTGGNTIGNQHVNTTHYDGNTSHGNPLGHNTATTGSTVGHHGTTGYADNNTAYGDDRNRADHKSGGLMDKISDKLSGNKDDRLEQDRLGHGAHGTQGAQGVPPAYGGQYAGDANRNTAL